MNTSYRSTKEIAATVRAALKRELPDWKFSVRIKTYSGGASITLTLMSGPEAVVQSVREQKWSGEIVLHPFKGHAQLNHYQLERDQDLEPVRYLTNGVILTPKGWEVMKRANELLSAEHWDKSDIQSDYFCCNFYRHVEIGQWGKPYVVKGEK